MIGALPTGRGVLGELITDPVPLRLADVGSHPRSYGFPAAHHPMHSFLGVPLLMAGVPFGNLYLTEKQDGGPFTKDDEQAAVLLADFAGVAIDHARRYTGSEQRCGELQRTVTALDATIQIARALGGQTDLGAILQLVAKRGRALVSARALVIELQTGDELVVAAGAGELPRGLVGQRVGLEGTVAGAALRSRQSQRLADELNRARFDQHGLGHLGRHAKDGLVVPLIFRTEFYGVLVAVDQLESGAFNGEHQRLLEAFAASAATAVATARSAADERRAQRLAAAEAERTRWARELHDETLQNLGRLRLGLAAVRALAHRVGRADVEVDVSVDLAWEQGRATERHTPELEVAIYRMVQEALTNATKHGRAQRAIVEIIEDQGTVSVTVRDDGDGFDTATKSDGFGLVGMHERVLLLDGTLDIESAPGQGATVAATFPACRRESGTRSHAAFARSASR